MGRAGVLSGCVTLKPEVLRDASSAHTDLPTIVSGNLKNDNFYPKHLPKAHALQAGSSAWHH